MLDTLAQPVSHTLEVKHSRFIAQAAPIDGAAAAMAFLQQVLSDHSEPERRAHPPGHLRICGQVVGDRRHWRIEGPDVAGRRVVVL